jgi:hypothetical protein
VTARRQGRPAWRGREALALGVLTATLVGWFLWPFLVGDARFPLGPDGPVYLWWTRLAGIEGLSAIGNRPGVPALALVLQGTLGLSVVQAIAALEVALGVAVGLGSAALVRRRTTTAGWLLAGVLGGTFAVHLAAGYLANLAIVTAFLSSCALLDRGERRPTVLGALVLAGGGLAHPLFFLLGGAILVVAAATAWRSDRGEAARVAGTALGGGALLGLGLLAVSIGPPPLDVDTSKDAFLRRAGLTAELRSAYADRFIHRWTRYVQWASVPMAIVGFGDAAGAAGRILRAWFLVTVAGIGLALATGWLPADRFVTFGFAIPILAALGLVRLSRRLATRRTVAVVVTGALTLMMLSGAAIAWNRQEPFLSEEEVSAVTQASAVLNGSDPNVPLAFVVREEDASVSFLATRAGNVIRAGVPPDRIRDVVVVVAPFEGAEGERRALERLTAADLTEAERRTGRPATTIRLSPFDPSIDGVEIEFGDDQHSVVIVDAAAAVDPLEPSSPEGIAWASIATLALLAIVGYGWSRAGLSNPISAAAAAPAIGASAIMLVAVFLDLIGVSLGETSGAVAASGLSGGGGYFAWFVFQRRARTRTAP